MFLEVVTVCKGPLLSKDKANENELDSLYSAYSGFGNSGFADCYEQDIEIWITLYYCRQNLNNTALAISSHALKVFSNLGFTWISAPPEVIALL